MAMYLAAHPVPAPQAPTIVVPGANREAAQRLNASLVHIVSGEDQALALRPLNELGRSKLSAVRAAGPAHDRTCAHTPHVGPGRTREAGA
jgi:hypothetical protein